MKKYSISIACIGTVLFLCGTANAIALSANESESAVTLSRLDQPNYPKDIASIRHENRIVRYDSTSLDSFIQAHMLTAHIPGLATWCFKDGQIIWQQCFGHANLGDSIEVTDSTMFALASISKTITGTAIMQLWERGVFELDDDINVYLPFSVRNPVYPDSAITFLMLMTHMSSIVDNWSVLDPLIQPGPPTIPLAQFMYDYLDTGGVYYTTANFHPELPGSAYNYSGVGTGLLGYLVKVLEDSFPIHCQDSIFQPLGMNHTAWYLPGVDTSNFAKGYYWNYSPCVRKSYPWYPAGYLYATAADLGKYITAIYQYGILDTVRILDSATVAEILTPRYEHTPGMWICLLWHKVYLFDRWMWAHNGQDIGFDAFMAFCPDENSAVIVLANGDLNNSTWTVAEALLDYAQQYGIEEDQPSIVNNTVITATIFRGPLQLPADKKYKVFDITGRVVAPGKIQPGIYFIEVDGVVTQKVVKVR